MKRIVSLDGCIDCPYVAFIDSINLGDNVVQIICTHMKLSELVRGGNAQKEIDILTDWFENKCDLEQIKSKFYHKGDIMEEQNFNITDEMLHRFLIRAYYDGCFDAFDAINQDMSDDSKEWFKNEAKKYADEVIRQLGEAG